MANLTKPTFVYTGTDSLILCQKKYRLNSPHYFRLHINSKIAKFQRNDFNSSFKDWNKWMDHMSKFLGTSLPKNNIMYNKHHQNT